MAAATIERLQRMRGRGRTYTAKMAVVKIWAGTIVATNSSGFAGPLNGTYNQAVLGVAEETVDNTGGSAGDLSIKVTRGISVALVNDGSNPVAQAHIGKKPGFIDDSTVNNAGGTPAITPASSADAVIEEIDPVTSEVWVFIN